MASVTRAQIQKAVLAAKASGYVVAEITLRPDGAVSIILASDPAPTESNRVDHAGEVDAVKARQRVRDVVAKVAAKRNGARREVKSIPP